MTLLTAAVIALWLVVLVLVVVVFALARQIGVLYERVAPAGALMLNQRLKVGDAAPVMPVETLTGTSLTVGEPGQLLFFLAPDCPICKTLLPVLKTMQRSLDAVRFVLLSDGDDQEQHRRFVAEAGLERFDYSVSELVGRSYGVGKLPYAVLIDAKGAIASMGIVNSREHLESLFEAERLGVASLQEYLGTTEPTEVPLYHDAADTGAGKP